MLFVSALEKIPKQNYSGNSEHQNETENSVQQERQGKTALSLEHSLTSSFSIPPFLIIYLSISGNEEKIKKKNK